MSKETKQPKRDMLTILQIIFTLLIAAGGLYLNMEQKKLSQKIESLKATNMFAETVDKYLDKVELDPSSKKELIVALLAIITETNLSTTGELSDEKKQQLLQLMPLHFALVSQNPDMLAHIGASASLRELWVPFALNSGNMKVKITAIQALERIGRFGNEATLLPYAVDNIVSLSRDGRIRELTPVAVSSLQNLLEFVDTELLENEQFKNAIIQALNVLQDISTELAIEEDPQAGSIESHADKAREALKADILAAKQQSLDVSQQIISKFNLTEDRGEKEIADLIQALESNDINERRSARRSLAQFGEAAVPDLIKALETRSNVYRVKLGAISALYLMDQPISLAPDSIKGIVKLIGDSDATVRINAANFLIKLEHTETVTAALPELFSILQDTSNPNGLYNSVVVLGEWSRRKSFATNDLGEKIRTKLKEAREILKGDSQPWDKTITKIGEYI